MVRAQKISAFAVLVAPALALAQAPQFKWTNGQTHVCRVSQTTTAAEKVGDKTSETVTKLDAIKRWRITAVDGQGVATLTMSLDKLRMEAKTPTGEAMLFDSESKDKSTPALAEELSRYIGVPLTVVRLDPRGQLVEIKECKFGPPSRLEADLPFKIMLPTIPLAVEGVWERKYQIKLDSQPGMNESYAAKQVLTCKAINGSLATIGVNTVITGMPELPPDQIPLCPLSPSGEVVFDAAAGRLKSVRFKWTKEITGHQGENSKYIFSSTYNEDIQ